MLSIFLAHAPADKPFAQEFSAFLEAGCEGISIADDAAMQSDSDLIAAAERGHSADVVVLLLSPASNPSRWNRERWEPVLFDDAVEAGAHVAVFLLEDCTFPPLLRRKLKFFNAVADRLTGMRQLKRWLWSIPSGVSPSMSFSPDLEALYRTLADRPGTFTASGAVAGRFAREAARDFEAVLWIPAHGRTLTRIVGDLGSQLQMTLDGPAEENCVRVRDLLSGKRCLLVLDAPQLAVDSFLPSGRASILFTTEPVRIANDAQTLAAARGLVFARRFAEAHEILRRLFNSGIDREACARELVWIFEHWDRIDEANAFRFHCGPDSAEQLRLF